MELKDLISVIPAKEIRGFLSHDRFEELYHLPEFMQAVAARESWYALVKLPNGETAFFPFTGQKWLWKWRIYQASFCQRFAVIGESGPPTEAHWKIWLQWLDEKTWFCHWSFFPYQLRHGSRTKVNQYFSLEPHSHQILANWKSNRKQGLKKSIGCELKLLENHSFFQEVKRLKNQIVGSNWQPSEKEILALKRISDIKLPDFKVFTYGVFHHDHCICLVLISRFKSKFHYLFSLSSPYGLAKEASSFFFQQFILEYAGQNAIFDFEGSSIPGVNAYFRSLGGLEEHYGIITI